jgi:hypothetical protein
MRFFACQVCGQVLSFENTRCERCRHVLGYVVPSHDLSALEPRGDQWEALVAPGRRWRFCANAAEGGCNWLVEADSASTFCLACRHYRTIPNLADARNRSRWLRVEAAKRRLFYSLLRLRLPLATRAEDPEGLAFDFLADPHEGLRSDPLVMTGHDNGLITLNLAEADDSERERRRIGLGEAYRTLLGHFRHEVGHYFWDRLVRDDASIEAFRALFGDERADYETALRNHYANGPRDDWQGSFVSAYARAHPWEDFAETFAHYLHMIDTLDTAHGFNLTVRPAAGGFLAAAIDFDAYLTEAFDRLIEAWLPVAFALNELNRSMGLNDPYPFVLGPAAIEKLAFVHRRIRDAGRAG